MQVSEDFSIDLISDLNIEDGSEFNWTGKPTSLFCAIAGSIGASSKTVETILKHLSTLYRGVFFIDGNGEHKNLREYTSTVERLSDICSKLPNVIYMHNQVVILDNIAFVGANCWFNSRQKGGNPIENLLVDAFRMEDLSYLATTLKNLQSFREAKQIVIFTSSPPNENLLHNKPPTTSAAPITSLMVDSDRKVTHWLFGGTESVVEVEHNGVKIINNPKIENRPYWPKRIVI